MADRPIFLTPEGKAALEQELKRLLVQREELRREIQETRDLGAFAEGGDADETKNALALVEGRIQTIENQLRHAKIVASHDRARVSLGSQVSVVDKSGDRETYIIVGSPEANPAEGKISNESPVGRALMGRTVGDKIHVQVPSGTLEFTIVEIN